MILERLQQLESRAELARSDGSLKQDLERAGRIRDRVTALVRLLGQITTAYQELSTAKPDECSPILPELRSIRGGLASLTENSNTQRLFSATPQFAEALLMQEKMARSVEKVLEDIWKTYRKDQREQFVDRDFLEILGRSGIDVEALLERLDAASFALERLDDRTLPLQGDTERLRHAVAGLATVAEGLSGVVPEAAAAFFRQADGFDGAPLSALTEEILVFLQAHNLVDRYSIRGKR